MTTNNNTVGTATSTSVWSSFLPSSEETFQEAAPPTAEYGAYIASMLETEPPRKSIIAPWNGMIIYHALSNMWDSGERVLQAMRVTAPDPKFNPLDLSKYFKHFVDFMEPITPLCEAGDILFLDEAAEEFKYALANAHDFERIRKATKAGYKFRDASFAAIEKMPMNFRRIFRRLSLSENQKANVLFLSTGLGGKRNRPIQQTRWILRTAKPTHKLAWVRYIHETRKAQSRFVRHCEQTMDAFSISHQGGRTLTRLRHLVTSKLSWSKSFF